MQTQSRIEITNALTLSSINRLLNDQIFVLIIKNYYPKDLCKKLATNFIKSDQLANYTHEIVDNNGIQQAYLGVDRIGFPFNLIYEKDESHPTSQQYYAERLSNIMRIRSYISPALTPIDKLRLELDEHYTYGLTIAAFQGQKMLAGIGRVSHANLSHLSEDEPHFDALPEKFCHLDNQFACNIYLDVPKVGGELELWDVQPLKPLAKAPTKWRETLPHSTLIKPNVGDLVLFNCRRPHAIRHFKGHPRVTMQTFIGYRKQEPLLMWN